MNLPRIPRFLRLALTAALPAASCFAQDPGFVARIDEAWRTHNAARFLATVDAEAETNACFESCFVQGVAHTVFGAPDDGAAAAAFDAAERFVTAEGGGTGEGGRRFDPVAVRSLRRAWESLPDLRREGKAGSSVAEAGPFADYPDSFPGWDDFDRLRARPNLPAFPFDGTIVSIDRDAKNAGDIGMEAGVVVGGLVGLGVGRVVELFDPPDKDDFLPPRIAGALGGAVLGGFFGGELQKERFPRIGRHWRATVAPANGAAPVSVDLGLDRGSWETNQLVRVVRDLDTGIISLAPNRALPTVDAEERK